jgi:uncharacterized protein YbdZ (MbtH family)
MEVRLTASYRVATLAAFASFRLSKPLSGQVVESGLVLEIYQSKDRMTNPFENNEASFLVLVNDENQHSIWPDSIEIPAGWKSAHGPSSRSECLKFVEENWKDMRPRSLAQAMRNPH